MIDAATYKTGIELAQLAENAENTSGWSMGIVAHAELYDIGVDFAGCKITDVCFSHVEDLDLVMYEVTVAGINQDELDKLITDYGERVYGDG